MTEEEPDEQGALMVLNGLPGMGPVLLNRMLEAFGNDPLAVLSAPAEALLSLRGVTRRAAESVSAWRSHFDIAREQSLMAACGAAFVSVRDPGYPPLLRELPDPPIGLYRKGGYVPEGLCVALVGSRKPSAYGLATARKLAAELAEAGVCIVSGLALGIDAAAHDGALAAGGRTVAVLGCGVDIVYPRENTKLYARIAETGAVFSEFPMGRPVDRQTFAMRNRIVSGMCRAVVVVESGIDGGSMITARFAGEQGRTLCAVPGRVDQRSTSGGCHQLIRDGAILVENSSQILHELSYLKGMDPGSLTRSTAAAAAQSSEDAVLAVLPEAERLVLSCFSGGEILRPDTVGRLLGDATGSHAATLLMLELRGLLSRRLDGAYEAVSR